MLAAGPMIMMMTMISVKCWLTGVVTCYLMTSCRALLHTGKKDALVSSAIYVYIYVILTLTLRQAQGNSC